MVMRKLLDQLRGRARIKGQVVGVMMLGVNMTTVSWHFGIHGVAPAGCGGVTDAPGVGALAGVTDVDGGTDALGVGAIAGVAGIDGGTDALSFVTEGGGFILFSAACCNNPKCSAKNHQALAL